MYVFFNANRFVCPHHLVMGSISVYLWKVCVHVCGFVESVCVFQDQRPLIQQSGSLLARWLEPGPVYDPSCLGGETGGVGGLGGWETGELEGLGAGTVGRWGVWGLGQWGGWRAEGGGGGREES